MILIRCVGNTSSVSVLESEAVDSSSSRVKGLATKAMSLIPASIFTGAKNPSTCYHCYP